MAKILIVGQAISAELEANLRAESFSVIRAHSGEQALSLIAQEPPGVVLVRADMMGLGVCHCIKSEPVSRLLPVLLVGSDEREISRGLEMGANDFVNVPVTPLELFARVRSLLRLKLVQDEVRVRVSREAAQFAAISQASQNADQKADMQKGASLPKHNHLLDFTKGAIGFATGAAVFIGALEPFWFEITHSLHG